MTEKRVPLYERLPGIYRIRDMEQTPPGQLRSFLSLVETVFGDIHENIESLYDDLFIESCDDWVIPYIGDLLGTTHLKGDPWTLRADVADTIALRRRKGTLASIERLTYDLTKWGVHCAELRDSLVWSQHLNHQRPDAGGVPPLGFPTHSRFTPVRGGTVTLRDPATLSLIGSPFDPFAHFADLKPPAFGNVRYNLPNLAIFLWRLEDYRVRMAKPVFRGRKTVGSVHVVRFDVHPTGIPTRLFNSYRFDPEQEPPTVTELDGTPGPIPMARLIEGTDSGNPGSYIAVDSYDPTDIDLSAADISDVGLQIHLPEPGFTGEVWQGEAVKVWKIRGANLCAWEDGLQPRVGNREIVVDPDIGRIVVGVSTDAEARALADHLLITYTYGAVGPVGAHPITRPPAPGEWGGESIIEKVVNMHESHDPHELGKRLDDLDQVSSPVLVEIRDSLTHILDLSAVRGVRNEDGGPNLRLNDSLIIRAADGQRPIILLKQPLRFRPVEVGDAGKITVRLEGLYISRYRSAKPGKSFPGKEPLIARAALDSLEIIGCTLDPGGHTRLDGSRSPIRDSLGLGEPYGFAAAEEAAFDQTPDIILQRTVSGPILVDRGYTLSITDSIIDAGKGVGDSCTGEGHMEDAFYGSAGTEGGLAVSGAADPVKGWGPATQIFGVTFLGGMRVESIMGRGGIWVHPLKVLDDQKGCIRYSYFSGKDDRLPQNLGCVQGTAAELGFVNEDFSSPGYGQITHTTDPIIKEQGPDNDAMGAFGFLMEAHKWRNIQIRFREFMPVGIRPIFIPIT